MLKTAVIYFLLNQVCLEPGLEPVWKPVLSPVTVEPPLRTPCLRFSRCQISTYRQGVIIRARLRPRCVHSALRPRRRGSCVKPQRERADVSAMTRCPADIGCVGPEKEGGDIHQQIIGNRHFPCPRLTPCDTMSWGRKSDFHFKNSVYNRGRDEKL